MTRAMFGIDLGTTNSSIAFLGEGTPVAIEIEEGSAIVPSVVSLDEETGRFIVGRRAKNMLAAFPGRTVRSVKRRMGEDEKIRVGGRDLLPEEISSHILAFLAERAAEETGLEVKRAVITVPAYFNDAQRRATIRAGELAGLEVSRIVNEPTAASLVYDHVQMQRGNGSPYVLVYDLGGGTFDVSVLEMKGEIKEVLASCGDTALGGDDFDELLAGLLLERASELAGEDLSGDRAIGIRLMEIAERAKIALSDSPFARVSSPAVAASSAGEPVNLDMEISRREYEVLIEGLVERTVDKVREALSEASLGAGDIGEIILVGGATRTPLVQQALAGVFDQPMRHAIDPDLCVALGAAVQAGLIEGEPLGHILIDVTAHSLGIKTIDESFSETGEADFFSPIIRRNTRIPVRKADMYFPLIDNQAGVDVEVYQGESPSCMENVLVGDFYFKLKPAPRKTPVTMEFAYDREGIVRITAEQKDRDNRREVTLDVRRKKIIEKEAAGKAGKAAAALEARPAQGGAAAHTKLLNYIIEKAKRLMDSERLPDDLRQELAGRTDAYAAALRKDAQEAEIDRLEEELLESMERAEERCDRG